MIRYLAGIKEVKFLVAKVYSDHNKFFVLGKVLLEWMKEKKGVSEQYRFVGIMHSSTKNKVDNYQKQKLMTSILIQM